MSKMTDLLPAGDISKAVAHFKEKEFDVKEFLELVGMKSKSKDVMMKVFQILDIDASGFIVEEELELILEGFAPEGRHLTDKEVKDMLKDGDKDVDGKISQDEFISLVAES